MTNRHNGIDRETIIEMMEINGCDTRIVETSTGVNPPVIHPYNNEKFYSISWLGQSVAFDFQKSLAPEKLLYDSEWHSQSTIPYRNPDLSGSHLRAAVWLAHLYGMGANLVWAWLRNGTEISKQWGEASFASFAFSPETMNAYFRTMIDVNSAADFLELLVNSKRHVALVYSEASAIHSIAHINAILSIYEALTFLGLKPGFVTEKMLKEGKADAYPWVIVPSVTCCNDSTINALEGLLKKGVKVTFAGKGCLQKYENGLSRKSLPPVIANMNSRALKLQKTMVLMTVLQKEMPATIGPHVICLDNRGKPAFGIICRSAFLTSKTIVCLVNVSKNTKTIRLKATGHDWEECKNMITGISLDSKKITIEPQGVALLELH